MGTMKRVIQCIDVTEDDEFAYCGTKTGELLKFKIDRDPIQVSSHRHSESNRPPPFSEL